MQRQLEYTFLNLLHTNQVFVGLTLPVKSRNSRNLLLCLLLRVFNVLSHCEIIYSSANSALKTSLAFGMILVRSPGFEPGIASLEGFHNHSLMELCFCVLNQLDDDRHLDTSLNPEQENKPIQPRVEEAIINVLMAIKAVGIREATCKHISYKLKVYSLGTGAQKGTRINPNKE